MKKALIHIIFLFALLVSCEDLIEVDVPVEPPRLTVDAVIRIDTSAPSTTAVIKLGLSSSFFDANEVVTADEVLITNLDYEETGPQDSNFIVFQQTAPGIYEGSKTTSFFTSGRLVLTISYNEELFLARTEFVPSVPIDSLEQGDEILFSGEETEVKIAYFDDGTRDDFYLFDFDFNQFLVSEDEFYQGQKFEFSYFYDDIEPGTQIEVSILGVDDTFYNYMNQLIVQSGGSQGPFQTPAATVKGNIINVTGIEDTETLESVSNSNNFALGYFAVVEEYKETVTIE